MPRAGEAVIRITTTTICGTDVHMKVALHPAVGDAAHRLAYATIDEEC